MIIHRLRLQNFRQHESTELVFGSGLTGIVGPNGAGKTTLLEAIAWAMYGMPAARGNRETIRRRGATPRSKVEVELDFSLGAHNYRILHANSPRQRPYWPQAVGVLSHHGRRRGQEATGQTNCRPHQAYCPARLLRGRYRRAHHLALFRGTRTARSTALPGGPACRARARGRAAADDGPELLPGAPPGAA